MHRLERASQFAATKVVFFDMGGVLVDLHSAEARSELIERYGIRSATFDELTRSCFTQPRRSITELSMIGRAGTSEYLRAFLRECKTGDVESIRANRLSVVGCECSSSFEIVKQLKEAGLVCCVLSNTIALHWEKLSSRRDYPSLAFFEHVFAYHRMAHAKPQENAFSFVANALNVGPSECLLIDDTSLNVEMAKAAGWNALLFTDAARLEHELTTSSA